MTAGDDRADRAEVSWPTSSDDPDAADAGDRGRPSWPCATDEAPAADEDDRARASTGPSSRGDQPGGGVDHGSTPAIRDADPAAHPDPTGVSGPRAHRRRRDAVILAGLALIVVVAFVVGLAHRTPPGADAPTTFGDGMWQAGVGIRPGNYRSTGGPTCTWQRWPATEGDPMDTFVPSWERMDGAPTIVALTEPGSTIFVDGCGDWHRLDESAESAVDLEAGTVPGDGTWRVGVDLAPGRWRPVDPGDDCEWQLLRDLRWDEDSATGLAPAPEQFVVVVEPDVAALDWRHCGPWERV